MTVDTACACVRYRVQETGYSWSLLLVAQLVTTNVWDTPVDTTAVVTTVPSAWCDIRDIRPTYKQESRVILYERVGTLRPKVEFIATNCCDALDQMVGPAHSNAAFRATYSK
jgi:hypothetical protein